jgi:chorismate mutase
MNNEFKKSKSNNETRYVLENSATVTTGSVATAPSSLGKVQKRGNILAQEAGKDKVPATTPRNFVAKNAKTSGAGAHKDKKKQQKQGAEKHKKPYMESLRTKIDQLKSKLAEAGMPFRGVGGAFNRGDDERHDLDPTDWYVVKDGKMFKTSVYPNQVQLAIAQGYSRTRDEAKAKAGEQGVAEGVAETLPIDDAVKVLRQYGADNFKTTSNELHFYKNGRPLSVDLIWGNEGERSVNLSQLNSATRQLKGQGVAEVSQQTLQSYRKKAAKQKSDALDVADRPDTDDATWVKNMNVASKRKDGIAAANKRLGVGEGFPKDPNAPKLVRDRKTGKQYDPNKEFEKKMNSPEVMAQMKRMAQKEGVEDRTSYQVAKILSDRGIKYDPAQENELINAIGMVLVKELNMSPKEARHLISYDEDFVSDTLGELRSMEDSVSEVDVYMESLAHSLQQVLSEKAVSKKQQKFMGMVHAAQKGEKPASKEVAKVAKDMGKKDAKDFASTKHKGLPEKKKSKK